MTKVSGQIKIYEMINDRIIDLLEKSEIPWRKPWVSGEPANFITKKLYRGINPFILISSGFSCPFWVSFKQAKGKGGRIKKGEKGFPVVFWKWIEVKDPEVDAGKKRVPFFRYDTVFNLEQTEGIDIPVSETRDFQPIMKAEKLIQSDEEYYSTLFHELTHSTGHQSRLQVLLL